MIYLDSSVALAYLLAEDRYPNNALWDQPIVSSRLLECEVWNRINTRRLANSHGDIVRSLIGRIAMIEMVPPVLKRALEPFPASVRTLDAIHLAAIEFIRSHGASVQLASYDERLVGTARLMGIAEWDGIK
jgi:predicted nucleic acid-binding protein